MKAHSMQVKNIEDICASPIIACGVARSGTTMLMDILNSHSKIAVQDEMHGKTLEAYFKMTNEIDQIFTHYSALKKRELDIYWRKSIAHLTHHFFMAANKEEVNGVGKTVLYHGIKTPGYEAYYDDFERVFEERKPIYVYSMRSVEKVWRSWKTIGFLDDVERFKLRYERSLRNAIKLKNKVKERFILFDLEGYIQSPNKEEYVNQHLFELLGVSFDQVSREHFQSLGISNTLKNKGFNEYVADDCLKDEMEMLASCEKIKEYKDRLREK